MKRQIDHFLLGTLWLLVCAMGASFWYNVRFGFDIFSGAHWRYLGVLQAGGNMVAPGFYISMILIAVLAIFGLYMIVRPRFRKIKLGTPPMVAAAPAKPAANPIPENNAADTSTGVIIPTRPPRLNIPTISNRANLAAAPTTDAPQSVAPAPMVFIDTNIKTELNSIFESAGFMIKNPPHIGNLRPTLFAIGPDEIVWIGTTGGNAGDLADAIGKLNDIFTETLEDITININAFIISPLSRVSDGRIKYFDSLDDLRDYINQNRSRDIPADEREDFDAYSEYIDTVTNYFNKQ
jgi:hypothetical protein